MGEAYSWKGGGVEAKVNDTRRKSKANIGVEHG